MAEYARMAWDAGARIIGGCCGTTPEHLRIMRAALETHTHGVSPGVDAIEARLGTISTGARAQLKGLMDRASGAAPGATTTRRTSARRAARGAEPV
jgi:5-methyltetrahydrofolate--homocysteine methyltransferase